MNGEDVKTLQTVLMRVESQVGALAHTVDKKLVPDVATLTATVEATSQRHFKAPDDDSDPVPEFMRTIGDYGDLVEPTAGKFVIHNLAAVPGQPGRHAKVRAIAKLWFLGRLALTEWGGLVDSWFQPFTHITYARGLSREEIQDAVDDFLELASRKIAATPEGTTVTLHDVPDQTPHKDFQDFVRRAQSVLLLGQESSQMVKEGQETGATLQGEVRDDIRDADARMLDASLNEALFAPLCAWNFGPDVAPPRIKHVIHESIDPEQRGRVFESAQRIGLRLLAEQVYGDLNLDMPDGTPDIIDPPAKTTPAPGFGPFGFRRADEARHHGSTESALAAKAPARGDPVQALAGIFEGHVKAARTLAERSSSAQEFQAGLAKLIDEFDTDGLAEAIHYATFGSYAAGRLNTAGSTTEARRHRGKRESFGQWFKQLRVSKGFRSARKLASASGLAASHVSHIERGECAVFAGDDELLIRKAFERAIRMMEQRTDILPKREFLKLEGLTSTVFPRPTSAGICACASWPTSRATMRSVASPIPARIPTFKRPGGSTPIGAGS